jgi:hypothetical protein
MLQCVWRGGPPVPRIGGLNKLQEGPIQAEFRIRHSGGRSQAEGIGPACGRKAVVIDTTAERSVPRPGHTTRAIFLDHPTRPKLPSPSFLVNGQSNLDEMARRDLSARAISALPRSCEPRMARGFSACQGMSSPSGPGAPVSPLAEVAPAGDRSVGPRWRAGEPSERGPGRSVGASERLGGHRRIYNE